MTTEKRISENEHRWIEIIQTKERRGEILRKKWTVLETCMPGLQKAIHVIGVPKRERKISTENKKKYLKTYQTQQTW